MNEEQKRNSRKAKIILGLAAIPIFAYIELYIWLKFSLEDISNFFVVNAFLIGVLLTILGVLALVRDY